MPRRQSKASPFMRLLLGLAWLGGLIGCASEPARAADPPSVMIILDGSGSMWGKLGTERQSKLLLTREAIRSTLPRLAGAARLGFASFGHRRSGDCSDVETLVRPTAQEPERVLAALDRINPKGRGPIAQSLREAAKELAATAGASGGSIILIHDDTDNCQQDPCAAAAEIKRSQPKTAVHVISLGMKEEDVDRVACVARSTGGKQFDVHSGSELAKAFEVALASAVARAPALVAGPKPAARAPAPPAAKPGLYLSASLGQSHEPLDIPVRWRVVRADPSGGNPVYQAEAVRPTLDVTSGRYEIEARLGMIAARVSVDIDAKAANRVNVPLAAGTIQISTQTPRGGRTSADVIITISKPEGTTGATTARPGEPVLVTRAAQSEIALQPGPYVVSVSHGLFRVDRPVIVAAGSRGKLAVSLPTGELEVQAVATSGGPMLEDAIFQVFEDDPDAPQGRRELARSAASNPSFTLAAGTYYVVARRGTAEARERVTVRSGEIERRTLVIGSARLTLTAAVAGNRPDSTDSVVCLVERIDGEPKEAVRTTQQGAVLDLAPGRYRVESHLGLVNAKAEREIDLKAGAQEVLMLEHQAGVVRLGLVEQPGALPVGDVFWEVKDAAGRIVWITSEAQPLGILQAGRYAVRAEIRDRRVERSIDVKAGDNRTIEILAQ
jgi:Ca-activated chloride channel family protein